MNEQNVKFLEDSLFYLGFGEKLNEQLEAAMKKGNPEFQLKFSNDYAVPSGQQNGSSARDKIEYELHFKKGNNSDMYFFNSYKAVLSSSDKESREQLFYVNKNKGVTAKEAYNLLSGRAVNKNLVNKEGKPYNGWIQLDFSKKDIQGNYLNAIYHENYGYKVEEALAQLPVKGSKDAFSEELINSLKKGNLTMVNFTEDGKDIKHLIAANPKYKSMDVYDETGKQLVYKKKEPQELKAENKIDDSVKKERKGEAPVNGINSSTRKTRSPRTRMPLEKAGMSLKK